MSYCRFENTARDLQDCVEAIYNGDVYDFNEYELAGFKKLVRLAEELASMDNDKEEIIEYYKNQD